LDESRFPAILAIEEQKYHRDRVTLRLEDGSVLGLAREVAEHFGLAAGATLSPALRAELEAADTQHKAISSALQLLGYRPRSEAELRDRLKRKGYDPAVTERVLGRLRELEIVDDAQFAEYWVANRETFRPRGARLLNAELRQKGVAAEVAKAAVVTVDEEEGAYRAAQKRLRSLRAGDFRAFRDTLGPYLQRRGFSYGVVSRVLQRCWSEYQR
jgi:regulatory protein